MIGPGYIVETLTPDGLRLKGFWQCATQSATQSRALWILVHGVCGNFYDSSLLSAIASSIFESGRDTVRINTRGHDPVAYIPTGSTNTRIGAAYEMIADAKLDLEAWLVWGQKSGYQKIGLLGHSLGAIKIALFSASRSDPSLKGAIGISPPKLNCHVLSHDDAYGSVFAEQCRQAKELVGSGKPEGLMTVRYPQPMLISAATFLDKYGSDLYDYSHFIKNIGYPCLWTFGRREVNGTPPSFRGCDRELSDRLANLTQHEVTTIDDADHNYTRGRTVLTAKIRKWMDDQPMLI
jgi:pimeloyl-ACP methyl ester carboxylesterase